MWEPTVSSGSRSSQAPSGPGDGDESTNYLRTIMLEGTLTSAEVSNIRQILMDRPLEETIRNVDRSLLDLTTGLETIRTHQDHTTAAVLALLSRTEEEMVNQRTRHQEIIRENERRINFVTDANRNSHIAANATRTAAEYQTRVLEIGVQHQQTMAADVATLVTLVGQGPAQQLRPPMADPRSAILDAVERNVRRFGGFVAGQVRNS